MSPVNTSLTVYVATSLFGIMASLQFTAAAIAARDPIYEHEEMRAWCVIGSILGAVLSVCFFFREGEAATPAKTVRWLAVKFFGSVTAGLILTPLLFWYMEWPVDSDTVLGVSGAMGFAGVLLLHWTIPPLQEWYKRTMNLWFGK